MIRPRITYANVVATLALVLAVGGASAFAATQLAKNSVGTKQLKNNAVTTAKIKNGAVTGAKVNLGTLGTVPSAASAASATNAIHANSADNASHANNADTLSGIGASAFSRVVKSSTTNNALVGTSGTARSATITAPQNGFLLAIASSDVFDFAETDGYNCILEVDGQSLAQSERTDLLATNNTEENCGTNAVVPVSAGSHVVNFNFTSVGPGTTVDETELDVVFIPLAG